MWVEVTPRRPDFCGQPPCPICFNWSEDNRSPVMTGLHKLALDLLQKCLDDLTEDQKAQLGTIARKMHDGGIAEFASPAPPEDSSPADIGMSSLRRLQGWLRQRRCPEVPKPRQLTCDEVIARQMERQAADKEKIEQRNERLKEAREIAKIFAEAERNDRPSGNEQAMLRGVHPDFIDSCRSKGIYDSCEILERWGECTSGYSNFRPYKMGRPPF
jgi:hypothetical protein